MNLGMAVHAAAALPHIDDVLAVRHIGDLWRCLTECRSSKNAHLSTNGTNRTSNVRCMALLAQHGGTRLEHAGNGAAVGVVAVGAIICHG